MRQTERRQMRYYIALVQSRPDVGFGVTLPDFPGWRAAVRRFDEARPAATVGLAAHIREMVAYGEAIPEPSSFEDLAADPRCQDCEALLVAAPPVDEAAAARVPARDPFHRISNDEWPDASA
jgi:predicted RNase H-like HicB family nuclease